MIAKLIVHDADRPRALARMRAALAQCDIAGPKSNIEFLERLVRHPAVVEGRIDTGYLDRHLDEFLQAGSDAPADDSDQDLLLAAATAQLLSQERQTRERAGASTDPTSPWAIADGWRLGHGSRRSLAFLQGEQRLELHAQGSGGSYRIEHLGHIHAVEGARSEAGDALSLRIDGRGRRFTLAMDAAGTETAREGGQRIVVHDGGRRLRLQAVPMYRPERSGAAGTGNQLLAPMPGRVVLVKAAVGDEVEAGQELMVIEAMKMELSLKAPRAGTVAEVRAAAGDFVEADAVLVALVS